MYTHEGWDSSSSEVTNKEGGASSGRMLGSSVEIKAITVIDFTAGEDMVVMKSLGNASS